MGRGALQGERELVLVNGAPPPRTGVGRDVLGLDPNPPHDRVGAIRPARRGIVGRGDLRTSHPDRIGPRSLGDRRVAAPQRGVSLGRDREVTTRLHGGVGEVGGEVPGVGPGPQPVPGPGRLPDGLGDSGQSAAQHVGCPGADVVVAGQQVSSRGESSLSPGRQVRTTRALALIVAGHALLLRPVDLHVSRVQIDGHLRRQRRLALGIEQVEGPLREVSDPHLDPDQMLGTEPAGQTRRRGRCQHRDHGQLDRSHIQALAIQGDQRIGTQQLGLRHPDQQLACRGAAIALLHRPDTTIEPAHHVQGVDELRDRHDSRRPSQRGIRRTDLDTLTAALPGGLATTYCLHRQGAPRARMINGLDNRDSPSRTGTLVVSRADQATATRGSGSEHMELRSRRVDRDRTHFAAGTLGQIGHLDHGHPHLWSRSVMNPILDLRGDVGEAGVTS